MSVPLMIGEAERAALEALRILANANPVDIQHVAAIIGTPEGKAQHMAQMTAQSVVLPVDFIVTFSIETGHPVGACRHMSMSIGKPGRAPNPFALGLVAQALGFVGGLESTQIWIEDQDSGIKAVNVIQPIVALSDETTLQ